MKKMGLIGFGRFGQVLYRQLQQVLDIQVYDPFKSEEEAFRNIQFA